MILLRAAETRAPIDTDIFAPNSTTSFGTNTEVELVPSIEQVRMVNSGTEATMSTVRLRLAGHTKVRIIPLFPAAGNHLRRDIPELIKDYQSRYQAMYITLDKVLGENMVFLAMLADYVGKRVTACLRDDL